VKEKKIIISRKCNKYATCPPPRCHENMYYNVEGMDEYDDFLLPTLF
jgi:hypothetical protein